MKNEPLHLTNVKDAKKILVELSIGAPTEFNCTPHGILYLREAMKTMPHCFKYEYGQSDTHYIFTKKAEYVKPKRKDVIKKKSLKDKLLSDFDLLILPVDEAHPIYVRQLLSKNQHGKYSVKVDGIDYVIEKKPKDAPSIKAFIRLKIINKVQKFEVKAKLSTVKQHVSEMNTILGTRYAASANGDVITVILKAPRLQPV